MPEHTGSLLVNVKFNYVPIPGHPIDTILLDKFALICLTYMLFAV